MSVVTSAFNRGGSFTINNNEGGAGAKTGDYDTIETFNPLKGPVIKTNNDSYLMQSVQRILNDINDQ